VVGRPLMQDMRQGRVTNELDASNAVRISFAPKSTASTDLHAAPRPSGNSALRPQTAHTEPDAAEAFDELSLSQTNGAAFAAAPRPNVKPNRLAATNGAKEPTFNGLRQGPRRADSRSRPGQIAAAPPPPLAHVLASEGQDSEPASLAVEGQPHETAAPVSILKSGVIEGMAYILYSDGSIEAELPQGKLRFGSIAALRDHLDGAA